MALRSLLRKMPALGLRSPAMGPLTLMSPVRALSPAAGSRFMSHGGPGEGLVTEEDLARGRQRINRMEANFWKGMEEIRETRRTISQLLRADIEEDKRSLKTLKRIEMACNAALILGVPAVIYMIANF